MSMFTLIISCLTTSNFPWFMDLTFQVPMQYCSLQHRTLLLSPVTSTSGYCFYFGSIPSFFLELFLHWSPVAYWAPTNLGSSLSYLIIFPFHTVHGVLKTRILKWFARGNINNLRYADDTILMAESAEELKSLLMKVKEESGKRWLKAQHSEN